MSRPATLLLGLLALFLTFGAPAAAQQSARGRLIVTVNDSTAGVLPTATVTIVGLEAATRTVQPTPLLTTNAGIAIFDNLVPGRYSAVAEFTGFLKATPKEVRVRTGDNRLTIVLELAKFRDEVTVGRDQQEANSDRASTFGSLLTPAQIAELSDDPAIMRQQLEDLAGPGVTIAVDSFEGGQLPNKSQIRSIRISRDQFAAESHYAGGIRIDIVTQPGAAELSGRAQTTFRTSAMDGQNPLVNATPPAQERTGGVNLTGSLIKNRVSFNLGFNGQRNFTTPIQAASSTSGKDAQVLAIKNRIGYNLYNGSFDWAVTKNQTARFGISRYTNYRTNDGAGQYDAQERLYSTDGSETTVQGLHTGPIGRRTMLYNRFYIDINDSSSHSVLESPTYIVIDDLTRGGAQRRGGTHTAVFSLNSDMDHVRGRHSFRTGLEVYGTSYRSDQETNYLGTFTFENPAAFDASRPRSYTRRVGDPNIQYTNTQVSVYFQDDIRLSKTLTMTPGVRYEAQTHVRDYNNLMPRFGTTWAPGAGKTTYRASLGLFYDWLNMNVYQQTLQFDGFKMQEVNMANPSFPDPGSLGPATPTQRYLLADDVTLPRTARASLGISRAFTKAQLSGVYAYTRAVDQLVGQNLNAPVGGVRPDPRFANVIQAVADGRAHAHSLEANGSLNLAGLGANPLTGPWFQWRRALRVGANYGYGHSYNNTDGAFAVPAATLAADWGPSAGDIRHRVGFNVGTTMIRGLNIGLNMNRSSARPLNVRSGTDDNGDLIFNDRPAGYGRNSERVPNQWSSSANFGYTFSFGSRMVNPGTGVSITSVNGNYTVNTSGGQPTARYRLNVGASITNLFNRPIWGGYNGIITSPFFLQPTSANGVRLIRMNVGLTF